MTNQIISSLLLIFLGMMIEFKIYNAILNEGYCYGEKHFINIMKLHPIIAKAVIKASREVAKVNGNYCENLDKDLNISPEKRKKREENKEYKKEKKSKYNEENVLREKQEIIKRNTAKDKVCGLSENGECKYVGYCKHQRKYNNYGSEQYDVLCMREGKGE